MKRNKKTGRVVLTVLGVLLLVVAGSFTAYFSNYYHCGERAEAVLAGDAVVPVVPIGEGFLFDGERSDTAIVFYPGAKVEAEAYAPLMAALAEQGYDCFLIDMPLNFALFDRDKALDLRDEYSYEHWYIGGHSLGGVAAAMLCNEEKDDPEQAFDGLILLASYPSSALPEDLRLLSVYGTNDKVLNAGKYEESRAFFPDAAEEVVIRGGNHAQFGDYGEQKGDGEASISPEEQTEETADAIADWIG